jgi:RNA polymerase-binding protein DksA
MTARATGKPAAAKSSSASKSSAVSRRVKAPARNARPAARSLAAAEAPQVKIVPGTSGLTKRDIEQFREALLQKRGELMGDVNTLQAEALHKNRQDAAGDLSNMPIHMADLGSDNYEQEFTLGLIEEERALLTEIDEALERMDRSVYGICMATGKPIGKARLKAKPWAKFSYEYMLAQERIGQRPV